MGQLLKLPYFWIQMIYLLLAYNYTVLQMVTTSEAVRVKAILDNINHIKKIFVEFNHANYEPSSLTLYTAQENDIRDACYNVILHCYFLEMRTVVEELTILKAEDTGELKLLHLLENLNISPTVSVMSCVMIGLLYQQVDFCAKTKGDHE
ncbi:hypothetical protein XENTR_v10000765 [Xenopus tropicalis]|nr:hypothetical protein XENTR_v10000765 [Xenopus tropicalis]